MIEAADRVGGRMATDEVDGFLLDRGFQVFLPSYPEARRLLDYSALHLREFEPGALVYRAGTFDRLTDPWRCPRYLLPSILSRAATLSDKLRIAGLRRRVSKGTISDIYSRSERHTVDYLREAGFSPTILDRFFRPFLRGIFLEQDLTTSSRMFEFVFRMFSCGLASLPADGMQAIPQQVASALPPDTIRLNQRVTSVAAPTVTLESGETLTARNIVVATDNPSAASLVDAPERQPCGVTCLYFATDKAPVEDPVLILNGEDRGPINNLCFPSSVAPSYAPQGRALVSATVLGVEHDDTLCQRVHGQLAEWFGGDVDRYEHLRTYSIPFALPRQVTLDPVAKEPRVGPGLYRCGDDMDTASINGALASGRRAAEAILASPTDSP